MTAAPTEPKLDDTARIERQCRQFLYREAALLDANDYREWLETCVTKDLEYMIPTRTTRQRSSSVGEFSSNGYHVKDRYQHMRLRVDRLDTEHAYAEDPPSRTCRFVTNVLVDPIGDSDAEVRSNVMVHRSQGDTVDYDLIAARREDTLRLEDGQWRLRRRLVLLNHTILPTANLGIFL